MATNQTYPRGLSVFDWLVFALLLTILIGSFTLTDSIVLERVGEPVVYQLNQRGLS